MTTHVALLANAGTGSGTLRASITELLAADDVLMPEGWWHYYSADVEHTVALAIGIPITYAGTHDPEEVDQ